jgi:hypothetical protein
MGGASRGCGGPWRGYLGTAPFPHQQFVIATHGEGHGWRLSVATVPWQGGCERNSSVRLDFGALPGGNCVCSSESVVSEKTGTGPTEDCLEGKDRFADAGSAAFRIVIHACFGLGPSFGSSADGSSERSITCTTNRSSGGSTATNSACNARIGTSKTSETGKAQAAQTGLLQHCGRTHKLDRRRVGWAEPLRGLAYATPFQRQAIRSAASFGFCNEDSGAARTRTEPARDRGAVQQSDATSVATILSSKLDSLRGTDVPVALIIEPDHVHYSKQPFEHEKAA